jgi:hypothetical protein
VKFYRVGTEVKVHLTYTDPVTFEERVRVKHGIVTEVTSQTRLVARIGSTTGYNLNLVNGKFESREKAGSTFRTTVEVDPVSAGVSGP